MICHQHRRTIHRHVLDSLDGPAEVVEIEAVQYMPYHLVNDGVESDLIDVVGGEMQMAKQRRPGVESEPPGRRNCNVVLVRPAVECA